MKPSIEAKLWNAGQSKEPYHKEIWYEIIDALLEDFQKLIKQDFEREPEINLDINSPFFGQWLKMKILEKSILSTAWSAVIGGNMVGSEKGNDVFYVSLTLFMFDVTSQKRLCLSTGESILEFVFEKHLNGHGYWRSLGWLKDGNYEWENVAWEDFKWE